MSRRLLSQEKLERIYRAAVRVLGEMGMKVGNRQCLEAMEAFGATIDYAQERAVMAPSVIDRMLEIVRAEKAGWQRQPPSMSSQYSIGGGGTCPWLFDDEEGGPRLAGEADCIEAFKILDTSPAVSCEPPVYNRDWPSRFEAIRCIQLGIETLSQTIVSGIDLFYPEQIPLAVELGRLYRDDPVHFLPAGNCPDSPLCVSKRIADLAVAKAPYRKTYAVPTMPVMGGNAPMTPAGAAVVGVAEILGGYVLAKALEPETPVAAAALAAMMDMRTGRITYVAPEVFAADVAIAEVFELFLDLPCRVIGLYIDAKAPGTRAVKEKLLRCLGLGLFGNLTGLHGTLDQGKVFSPTQMMLDYDLHRFLAAYTSEPAVTDDCLGVDAILDIAWDSKGHLMHEHTRAHMRDAWQAATLNPGASAMPEGGRDSEQKLLAEARERWREDLKRYKPPNHSDDFLRDLRAICGRAKRELAG